MKYSMSFIQSCIDNIKHHDGGIHVYDATPALSKKRKHKKGLYYGRGLGSQCYLTCLHASCNVATFNVWLFNAWYSCFNSIFTLLHSISSFCNLASVHLTFVLRPCRIFIVQCVMPFFVLPLFILRPAIILTSSCHHCFVYANCNFTSRWRFPRRWSLKVVVRVRVGEKPSWEFKLLTISLFVHGFLPNLEVFILVRVEVCHKLWILPNSQDIG